MKLKLLVLLLIIPISAHAATNAYDFILIKKISNIQGGQIVNRVTKSVNYTNTVNDYMISWAGTTSAQPTNFFLAAPANGTTFIAKDGQRSASTTNIVIFPLGADTINGTTSMRLLQNGQSLTFTYNSTTGNWEPN